MIKLTVVGKPFRLQPDAGLRREKLYAALDSSQSVLMADTAASRNHPVFLLVSQRIALCIRFQTIDMVVL